MKRWIAIFMAATCTLSLAACGNAKPSETEVQQAIESGNMTIDDALSKGLVDQEWVDNYIDNKSVPAANKTEAGAIGEFTTTTLSGEEFSHEQIADVTLFVFLDPTDSEAAAFYQALTDSYEGVKENGAEILVCTKSENGNELFETAPFPVIHYNDSLKNAVGTHKDMIEGMPNTASWCVNTAFFSSWYSAVKAEELPDSAASFVEMHKEMSNGDSANSGMAVMG